MITFLESIIMNGMFLNLGWNGLCIHTSLNYQKTRSSWDYSPITLPGSPNTEVRKVRRGTIESITLIRYLLQVLGIPKPLGRKTSTFWKKTYQDRTEA